MGDILDELDAKAEKATPREWKVRHDNICDWSTPQIVNGTGGILASMSHYGLMTPDADFVVSLVNSYPTLAARLRKAEQERDECIQLNGKLASNTIDADSEVRRLEERLRAAEKVESIEERPPTMRDLLDKISKIEQERDEARAILKKASKAAYEVLDFFVEQARECGEEGVPVVLTDLMWLAAGHKSDSGEGVGHQLHGPSP